MAGNSAGSTDNDFHLRQGPELLDNDDDDCERGDGCRMENWTSTPNQWNGCRDATEDVDDDNDGVEDTNDSFPFNALEWAVDEIRLATMPIQTMTTMVLGR